LAGCGSGVSFLWLLSFGQAKDKFDWIEFEHAEHGPQGKSQGRDL
jgi:hypothetical protein